jgi:hypothetical protein
MQVQVRKELPERREPDTSAVPRNQSNLAQVRSHAPEERFVRYAAEIELPLRISISLGEARYGGERPSRPAVEPAAAQRLRREVGNN